MVFLLMAMRQRFDERDRHNIQGVQGDTVLVLQVGL